jgi:phosphatidylinositol alpha-1,6-mannosyltransferase
MDSGIPLWLDEVFSKEMSGMALLILTDNYPPQPGGIGTYAYELARNLKEEGVEVIVLAPRGKGDREVDSREKFVTYRLVKERPFFELHALILLIYLALCGHVDRICCMTLYPCGSVAVLVSLLFKVPYYVVAHGGELLESDESLSGWIKYRILLGPARGLALRKASGFFVNSNYTKRILMGLGVVEERITLIPCGTDPEKFQGMRNREKIARKYGLEGKKVLLTVARLESHKGQDTVISLMPELIKKIPNLVYVIVGTGRQEAVLKDMVRRLNLNGYVRFQGWVPEAELVELYNVCDVFVMISRELASEFEGFGVAFLEANACGRPVIGGKSGGISEAVVHGKTGLLVNPDDHQEIARAILRLLTEESFARSLGERGRQRVVRELNWRASACRIRDRIYPLSSVPVESKRAA